MRSTPAILHLDMDAFYASVEQAAKPSLRGKPVIVGGVGGRGVVATASYEARTFGVRSAMATGEARRRCPNAAFLVPRFTAYREVSELVMTLLGRLSPLVEPLSLDEAFVDLEAGPFGDGLDVARVASLAAGLRGEIHDATGLTASVGVASSKLVAKIASETAKPDGLVVVPPGGERALLDPLPVRALWGVGPATAEAMRKVGIATVADIAAADPDELIRLFGQAHGRALHEHARGLDDRPVVAERDAKSISVEDTFEVDLVDRTRVAAELDRLATRCVERLRAAGRTGRTVVVKMRRYDFSTLTRSETLRAPTDDLSVVRETAQRLAAQVDFTGGLRLLGVGVASLADFAQQDLFAGEQEETGEGGGDAAASRSEDDIARQWQVDAGAGASSVAANRAGGGGVAHAETTAGGPDTADAEDETPRGTGDDEADEADGGPPGAGGGERDGLGRRGAGEPGAGADASVIAANRAGGGAQEGAGPGDPEAGAYGRVPVFHPGRSGGRRWFPGQDVEHAEHGPGWVQGSGVGRVTVRFETPGSAPGRVRTFPVDDPALRPSEPLPLAPMATLRERPEAPGDTGDAHD
ncbi:DNA polymerase IV [Yinghuangia sp. ASG 101]|uniref:DNA polymerase IV n=1 Tax=Yinghuangia sp. ASG 101 TaxID=2896848 RepID=UPI001E51B767|nr:DNA polymerase IV [Yinghuangia sp. ASG 101]UGQ10770.1 DNA polymerase IV [Yinghuangia sp. ASG 101]